LGFFFEIELLLTFTNDVQEEECKTATQLKGVVLPIQQSVSKEPEARAITEEEKKFNAFNAICQVKKICDSILILMHIFKIHILLLYKRASHRCAKLSIILLL